MTNILIKLVQVVIAMVTEAILRKGNAAGADANEALIIEAIVTAAKLAIEAAKLPIYVRMFINDAMLYAVAKAAADLVEELIAKGLDLVNKK
jgi:hypothetical protein